MKTNLEKERENIVNFGVNSEKEKLVLENLETFLKISGNSITDGLVIEKIDAENWILTVGQGDTRIQRVIVAKEGLGDYIRLILETPKEPSIIISISKDISILHICIDKNENFGEDGEKEYKVKIIANRFTFEFDFDEGDNINFNLNDKINFRMF